MAILDDLIAWWDFEADGSDSHGVINLTNNGAAFTTGKVGNAALFEEANGDYLTTASSAVHSVNGSLSFAGWINFTGDSSLDTVYLCRLGGGSGGNARSMSIRLATPAFGYQPEFVVVEGFTSVAVSTSLSYSSGWHFVAVYFDATTGTVGLSIDGGAFDTNTNANLEGGIDTTIGDLYVGSISTSGGFFEGLIDSLGLWHRVLDDTDVAELYNSGDGVSYADIAGGGEEPVEVGGVASGLGGSNAALLRSILIQAQAQGSSDATAALRALRQIQAATSGVGGTQAALTAKRLLSASASGKGELSAEALVSRFLSGLAAGTGGASAAATVGGGHELSALLSGSGGASMAARITRRLEAAIEGIGGVSAAPQIKRRLAGTASGVGSAEAFVGSALILAGIASGEGGASASIKRAVQALGVASGEGGASAALEQAVEHGAGGTVSGAGAAAAAVMIRRFLEAAASGVAQAQAGLIVDLPAVVKGPLYARWLIPNRAADLIRSKRTAVLA